MYRPQTPAFSSPRPWKRLAPLLATLSLLAAAVTAQDVAPGKERPIGPGVRLRTWTQAAGPHALYAVEVERSQAFISLGVTLGAPPNSQTLALETVTRQAERATRPDRYPIAGVNGDFFYYPGTQNPGIPTNAAVLNGELLRTPFPRSSLVVSPDGGLSIRILKTSVRLTLPDGSEKVVDAVNHPRGANQLILFTPKFGGTTRTPQGGVEVYLEPESFPLAYGKTQRARVTTISRADGGAVLNAGRWVLSGAGNGAAALAGLAVGDRIQLRADFNSAIGPKDQILGGGPRLVREGRIAIEPEGGSINGAFATTRHPRTAVGYNGRSVFLLVVDGRQPGYSDGMSLQEVAQALVDLGCTDGMNLDGGGSSALWVRGSLVNRPSDGRERPVANSFLVFSTAPKGEPVRLSPTPEEVLALPGATVTLTATGEDRYYNRVAAPTDRVTWTVDPRLGTVTEGRFTAAAVEPPEGQDHLAGVIEVAAGGVRGTLPVRVYARPSRLEIQPTTARVAPNAPLAFRLRAFDGGGNPLAIPQTLAWSAGPEAGTIGADGVLTAAATPALGTITATIGGVTATARVEVTEAAAKALEDFENSAAWGARLVPPAVVGRVTLADGVARSGKRSLRIDYDFSATSGTRAVYAVGTRTLGRPLALKLWVQGDGQGAWLRVRVRDAKGQAHLLDAARSLDWKDTWRELRVPLSEDLAAPITLDAIYIVETDDTKKPRGTIYIDDLSVEG